MRRFNGAAVESIMTRLKLPEDVPIEAGMVTKAIRSAQTQVEQQNFEIRKNVLKYDEVLNKQRTVIYEERRLVLAGENIKEQIENMFTDVVTAYVDGETSAGYAEDWNLDKLWTALRTLYPVGIRWQSVAGDDDEGHDDLSRDTLLNAVLADAREAYANREAEIDGLLAVQGGMRELERQMLLQVMDRKWREHLYEMDYLKEGIGLRAMAQRDPLIEYQREGFDMFSAMLDGIKEETVALLFHVQIQVVPAEPAPTAAADQVPTEAATQAPAAAARPRRPVPAAPSPDAETTSVLPAMFRNAAPTELSYSGPDEDGGTATRTRAAASGNGRPGASGKAAEPSRNRPCPCGSGRKYKQCHGSPTAARP
jgi:preprotein translocase subunit SecA